jgi:hypothetical protein
MSQAAGTLSRRDRFRSPVRVWAAVLLMYTFLILCDHQISATDPAFCFLARCRAFCNPLNPSCMIAGCANPSPHTQQYARSPISGCLTLPADCRCHLASFAGLRSRYHSCCPCASATPQLRLQALMSVDRTLRIQDLVRCNPRLAFCHHDVRMPCASHLRTRLSSAHAHSRRSLRFRLDQSL